MEVSLISIQHTILSRPAEVHFMGFRSDTTRLQQAGWEIAAEQDIRYDTIRLLLRHQDLRLYAMSQKVQYNFRANFSNHYAEMPRFDVLACNHRYDQMVTPLVGSFGNFSQIDAVPQFIQRELKSIEDFGIFATPLVRTDELIVEPKTVPEMLEQIRKMQAPEQQRLRAKERLRGDNRHMTADAIPRQRFHAQIISIEDYKNAA